MPPPPYLTLLHADITQVRVDAIVNAANPQLAGGGGVDGAIHRAAGYAELRAACAALGGCATGDAKATPAFALPARHIIHAVGPVYRGPQSAPLLASAYRRSLELASELGCRSIAFPALSCGVYGYPLDEALQVSREAILSFQAGPQALQDIRLVYFDAASLRAATKAWGASD